jgi:hypothetical protein
MRSKSRQQKWSCAERGQQLSAAEFDPFAIFAAVIWAVVGLSIKFEHWEIFLFARLPTKFQIAETF